MISSATELWLQRVFWLSGHSSMWNVWSRCTVHVGIRCRLWTFAALAIILYVWVLGCKMGVRKNSLLIFLWIDRSCLATAVKPRHPAVSTCHWYIRHNFSTCAPFRTNSVSNSTATAFVTAASHSISDWSNKDVWAPGHASNILWDIRSYWG